MLCIAIGLYFFGAYAQSESSLIDTILVRSTVHSSSHIAKITDTDNTINIVEAIQHKEAIYFKNYGGFNLSTISLRGSSSSQTGMYWNNLSINNNMLGLLDLSLIPISFIEETDVIYGSESSFFGSGNIGGGVYLKNKPSKEKISISSTIGSFNNYSNSIKLNFGKKYNSSIKLSLQNFKNNYPFILSNGETRNLENGDGFQLHGMYNSNWNFGKTKWSFNYWTTYANRNIPFTSRQSEGDDSTIDINNRFNLNYKRIKKNSLIEWNSGFFINNNQFYQTTLINKNIIRSFENRLIYRKSKNNLSFTIGADQSTHVASSANYLQSLTQFRTGIFSNISWKTKYLCIDIRARQEIIDNKFSPFIPEINISKEILHNLNINLKANRVYRNPTLNDLYWVPGGNPDLNPESGWTSETNLNYSINKTQFKNIVNIAIYNRTINNWIIWVPDEMSFIFKPRNISEVWSRGLEFSNSLSYNLSKKAKISYDLNYNLNKSTYQISLSIPRVNQGDQLFYTPVNQLNNSLNFYFNNFQFQFANRSFSKSIGINDKISPYNITDFKISQTFKQKKNKFTVSLTANNLFNKAYEIIEFRPMPGRNFSINLNYKLN